MTGVRRHGLPDVAIPWNAITVRLACTLTPSGGGLGRELHWQLRVAERSWSFLLQQMMSTENGAG